MRLGLGTDISVGYRKPLFGGVPYLLDIYTGAAAAYSLRQLRTGVTNVVRVRRDTSPSVEEDFTAEEITDGTLLAFVGAGNNGHVVTWYDQSGNGNHATQATAANQPKLVSAGSLVTKNGLPAIDFDGSDDYLIGPAALIDATSAFTIINVVNENTLVTNNGLYNISSATTTYGISKFYNSGPLYTPFVLTVNNISTSKFRPTGTVSRTTSQRLIIDLFDGIDSTDFNSYKFSIDSTIINAVDSGPIAILTSNQFRIGRAGASFAGEYFDGNLQEFIIFPSDQSANRAAIESDINSHYSIY